ncbi:hypothetical protein EVAR_9055_1 [Eumeta japonica]|uniref:Uncharacterized protein n=1 Tax=Eumeta variegata TaxID=151549 RepID=A0A4C1TVY9_EUMVA|nr:hypothetical protein EVAR_9055_1 [Eumeta japonica]
MRLYDSEFPVVANVTAALAAARPAETREVHRARERDARGEGRRPAARVIGPRHSNVNHAISLTPTCRACIRKR